MPAAALLQWLALNQPAAAARAVKCKCCHECEQPGVQLDSNTACAAILTNTVPELPLKYLHALCCTVSCTLAGMATPAVSGVAGLVWSAHTACGAAEIRNALLATAKMPQGATPDGTTYVRGTRNNDVGFGIVQALAAHKYLVARPCKAPPRALQVTVLVRPDGVNGTDAKATALPPDALRTVGQRVTLIVKLRDADGNPVVGQKVRISVQPSPDMVKCGAYERATNVFGAFGVRCAVTKEGRAVLTATVPAGPGVAASKGQSTLNIRRAGQQTKLPR